MQEQYYYGHGKLLLTGEYFVFDGALSLGLPTTVGQSMKVKQKKSFQPILRWSSLTHAGEKWFEADFEFWHFNIISTNDRKTAEFLQKVLKQVRKQNIHFLRDEQEVEVTTKLEFPLEWGLGSSSTLIYNIAQWAYIGPFDLLRNTLGGSGYDIACAQSMGPILYQLKDQTPNWKPIDFNPSFKSELYLLYLGKKVDSREGMNYYKNLKSINKQKIAEDISLITEQILNAKSLKVFEKLIHEHEDIISKSMGLNKIKDIFFSDYWGQVKSLGAWGGDFALVTSSEDPQATRNYFIEKGYTTFIPFCELVTSLGFNKNE
jgi:mevalonate kinase